MPKILRIINRFNLGGPTYNVAYLSKYLAPEFETLLVGGEKDDSEDSSEFILHQLGLEPRIIKGMRREISFGSDRQAYKELKKIIEAFRPDIVHTHASKAGALGRMAAHACKVPVIVHTFHGHVFHSYFGKAKTTFYKNVERYLAKRSHAIVAISEKQKEEIGNIHKICPPGKIHIVPLGFDLSRFNENTEEKRKQFRAAWNISDDQFIVSIVGRLVPVKNHALFLDAFAAAKKGASKKITGFVVGDGESRAEIEAHARALHLRVASHPEDVSNADIVFTSWIKDVDSVYAGSDLVALSSWNEGTPVSLIEAQAAGKAIVSTDVGGIGNVVLPGETALLSPTGDVPAFTNNLLQLIEDDARRNRFAAAGWPHVREKFHYTRLVNDMAVLYRSLLGAVSERS